MKRLAAVVLACLIAIPSVTVASRSPDTPARQSTASSPVAGPAFVFPTNGTTYPAKGPYLFQVQPINGATGYLWSFVEGGMIVYQNLAWDGHLSPASYMVAVKSKAHRQIQPGDLHVWVRALM